MAPGRSIRPGATLVRRDRADACGSTTSTTTCRPMRSPRRRPSRATPSRLLVLHRALRPPSSTPRFRDIGRWLRAGRPAGRQRLARDPGPAARRRVPAAGGRGARPAAARGRRRALGGAGAARRAGIAVGRRRRARAAATASRWGSGWATALGRSASTATRTRSWPPPARCRCRPTSADRSVAGRALPDGLRQPSGLRRRADRRPALHAGAARLARGGRRRAGERDAARRARHLPAAGGRVRRRAPHPPRVVRDPARRRDAAIAAAAARRRRRHDGGPRPRDGGAHGRRHGLDRPLHHAAVSSSARSTR